MFIVCFFLQVAAWLRPLCSLWLRRSLPFSFAYKEEVFRQICDDPCTNDRTLCNVTPQRCVLCLVEDRGFFSLHLTTLTSLDDVWSRDWTWFVLHTLLPLPDSDSQGELRKISWLLPHSQFYFLFCTFITFYKLIISNNFVTLIVHRILKKWI